MGLGTRAYNRALGHALGSPVSSAPFLADDNPITMIFDGLHIKNDFHVLWKSCGGRSNMYRNA